MHKRIGEKIAGRVYDLVRSLVESLGGFMTYEKNDFRYGAWIITMGEKSKVFEAGGDQSFPEFDKMHKPKVQHPQHWDDYLNELQPDAKSRLLITMGLSPVPENENDDLFQLIERAKWKFAWTYARTYPHEYTTKAMFNLEDHAKLIGLIEKYGIVEPFNQYRNKYLYFSDRKYWHMGNPYSEEPAEQPNIINRTWLDVRRHSENVKHVWTPEEVELQMRIWEIQLKKKKKS
jgi:hypothetical protein